MVAETALLPVLPFTLAIGHIRVLLFTVIVTFGTAQDVTGDELRIGMMFPAEEIKAGLAIVPGKSS